MNFDNSSLKFFKTLFEAPLPWIATVPQGLLLSFDFIKIIGLSGVPSAITCLLKIKLDPSVNLKIVPGKIFVISLLIKSFVIFTIPEKVLIISLSGKLLIIGLLKIVGGTAEKIFLLIIKVSFENGFVPIILSCRSCNDFRWNGFD